MQLWLEIAIGLLVGWVFIMIVLILIAILAYLLGGQCAMRWGKRLYNDNAAPLVAAASRGSRPSAPL